uniref:Secreted protein n=1 Tax=Glossina brevipalpis TaxID=37001 RepID=A0A1A9WD50_9MUSC
MCSKKMRFVRLLCLLCGRCSIRTTTTTTATATVFIAWRIVAGCIAGIGHIVKIIIDGAGSGRMGLRSEYKKFLPFLNAWPVLITPADIDTLPPACICDAGFSVSISSLSFSSSELRASSSSSVRQAFKVAVDSRVAFLRRAAKS